MAPIHAATSGPRARELVRDVLAEFDEWADYCVRHAAAIAPADNEKAARFALNDIRAELMDHLVIRFGITLASWAAGDGEWS